jgi:hypothetical protein
VPCRTEQQESCWDGESRHGGKRTGSNANSESARRGKPLGYIADGQEPVTVAEIGRELGFRLTLHGTAEHGRVLPDTVLVNELGKPVGQDLQIVEASERRLSSLEVLQHVPGSPHSRRLGDFDGVAQLLDRHARPMSAIGEVDTRCVIHGVAKCVGSLAQPFAEHGRPRSRCVSFPHSLPATRRHREHLGKPLHVKTLERLDQSTTSPLAPRHQGLTGNRRNGRDRGYARLLRAQRLVHDIELAHAPELPSRATSEPSPLFRLAATRRHEQWRDLAQPSCRYTRLMHPVDIAIADRGKMPQ